MRSSTESRRRRTAPVPRCGRDRRDDASDLSGHGVAGRRHRRGAFAGDPSAGRGAAGHAGIPSGRFSSREPQGPSKDHLRRGGRGGHGHQGGAQVPDNDRRGESQRHSPPAARPVGHSPPCLHDSRCADQFSPRARSGHRADRDRGNLRRPRPDDRRRRSRQPAHRRAPAGDRSGALRLQPGPQDRQEGHQLIEVHDPEGHRRPVRAGDDRGGAVVSRGPAHDRALRCACSARSSWRPNSSRSCWCSTSTATSCRTWPAGWPARWASAPAPTWDSTRRRSCGSRSSTPPTARPPTSPARTWPTPRPSSWPCRCCLYQIGEITLGQVGQDATLDLLREGVRTRDLGGQESTESFTEAVAAEVARRLAPNIGRIQARRRVQS